MSAYIRYAVGLIGIAIAALRSDVHAALLLMAVVAATVTVTLAPEISTTAKGG